MLLTRSSIFVVLLILANLTVSLQRLSGQDITILDTLDYIPMDTEGALEYNLMIASSKGLQSEISRLLSKGAEIDAETYQGATALIFAVANNRHTAVEALLAWQPNVDKQTAGHETPLLIAVKNMNTEIAETLIRGGADIDLPDNHGATPLHYAAVNGDLLMTDLLLYYDADCNLKSDDGTTPLMASILSGYADVADLLFQNGANLEARDLDGFTPFLIAAQNGDTTIMSLLLKEGVDLYEKNIHNYNALALAIQSNHIPAAEFLLEKGDLWNDQEKGGVNPYTVASAFGRKDITLLLEKYNIKGKPGLRMDVVSLTVNTRVNNRDFLAGLILSFKEPLLNAGFMVGFDTKPFRTRVIKEAGATEFYQYLDKSSLAYAGLFKDFTLMEKPSGFTIMASASLSAGYNFGPRFNGTLTRPESKVRIMPAAGIKFEKSNLGVTAGIEYLKTEFYKIGPLWGRLGFTYNYRLSRVRKHEKTIEW
ncbi:MAG: ankyrin repeat domain-containing protein [Bacteroidales bacterium]|nr:ankyrin repeat domain-containing protein [Bacteroidales bacterium]